MSRAIDILDALVPLIRAIPVVGVELAAVLKIAKQACKTAEDLKTNREAYKQLARGIATYAAAVSRAAQASPRFSYVTPGSEERSDFHQESWIENIRELTRVFREVAEVIDKKLVDDQKRQDQLLGGIRRARYDIWHKVDDQEQVERLREKIEEAVQSFYIKGQIWESETLERIESEIKYAASRQTEERQAISIQQRKHTAAITARQTEELRAIATLQTEVVQQVQHFQQLTFIEQKLKPVQGSRFGEEGMPHGCLPHTCKDLMARLCAWVNDNSEHCSPVFVLTGPAGTGKTTLAISFCEEFDTTLPVITFFVSQAANERRIPTRIVQTIAYQLGTQHAAALTVISDALRSSRDITARTLAEQVGGLFTAPLMAWEGSQLPVLVIIDALDECYKINGCEGGNLIPLIATAVRQLSGRMKLLITSREEPQIWKMLREMRLNTSESSIRLQNIEHTVFRTDITLYYEHHFRIISQNAGFEGETPWPSRVKLDRLVELTGRLFVFAAFVVRLLSNQRANPKERLEEILQAPTASANVSVFEPLDNLYLDVLTKAIDTGDKVTNLDAERRIGNLIGALVHLQTPLSARTMAALLDEDIFFLNKDIEHLSAVLVIPDSMEDAITIFHPSFSDYVQLRCNDKRFMFFPEGQHAYLLRRCLFTMNRHLKRDICNTGDESLMNSDIENLEKKRSQYLPLELQYACEYWLNHLVNASNLNCALIKEVNLFCEHHLLHWIEALSLLEKLTIAHVNLPSAISQFRRYKGPEAVSATLLLEDAERVVKTYDTALRACALQAYCSVLVFIPECKLYEHAKHDVTSVVEVKSERSKGWHSVRQTLQGHKSIVTSVAYSSDGKRIASGSSDHTVRVWDATTGAALAQFKGHTDYVSSVAFSPDGSRIASSSFENTVRVWDAITGATLVDLNGHTDCIRSASFSPDGTRIVSGSDDTTVRVWNAITGVTLAEFSGHTGVVQSVKFSPDGIRVASGSLDKTVRIWDSITGTTLVQLRGHTRAVNSVAFSPDCTRIASCSDDKTVRIWDMTSGAILVELSCYTSDIYSIAFSPDGTRIASGSSDYIVRVWDVTTGATIAELSGHTNYVRSVTFSPDGVHIASGSDDTTVRVWDATRNATTVSQLNSQADYERAVAFSPDCMRIASSSSNYTILLWEAATGVALAELYGHTSDVRFVAFSPDGTRIASGSHDSTVRVWDTITGTTLARFDGHTKAVRTVAFSPDSTRIVSGSDDCTVRVWDTVNGIALAELNGHTNRVVSAAFSEDGTQVISQQLVGYQRIWLAGKHFPINDLDSRLTPHVSSASLLPLKLSFEARSGWLHAVKTSYPGSKRVCWIPPERRGCFWTYGGLGVLFTNTGSMTILSHFWL